MARALRSGSLRVRGTGSSALCFAGERSDQLRASGPNPARRRAEATRDQHLEGLEKHAGRRLLLVDDEPSMRLLCSINLELAGFEVTEAVDGAHALQRAATDDFDLVLLDVMLPDIGGYDVARRLSSDARTRGLPIVFLSARADRDDLVAGYELGAVDYITKPFDPVALAARVDEALGRVARKESESYRLARLAELGG